MGRYFALTLDLPGSTKTKVKTKKVTNSRPRGKSFGFLIVFLLLGLGMFYITQVNNISTKGYDIKKLEVKLNEMKESNKRLELQAASLKSINNLESEVKTMNLIPSEDTNYIEDSRYSYNN